MKILHIVSSYYPAIKLGGPIQSVHLLNKQIAKGGISVDVLTLNVGLEENKSIIKNKWNTLDGVRVKYLNYFKLTRYNFSFSFILNCFRIIKDYDVIHITGVWNFPVLAGALAASIFKKPFIFSPRGSLYKESVSMKSSKVKKIYYFLFSSILIKKAALIHYTTREDKIRVQAYTKSDKQSIVIPNGIDIESIQSQIWSQVIYKSYPQLSEKRYILFMGRISKIKGFDILLPAFSDVIKTNSDLNLVIAGPDERGYAKEVKAMAADLNLTSKVFFTGLIDGEVKWSAYENAELFVLPSYSENFGNVVIEAMVCGTPVIISGKVGIHNEVKDYNAGIVVKPDAQDLCKGLLTLLNDNELKNKLVSNGRRLVKEKYDIKIVSDKMIEAYKLLVSKN